MPEHKIIQRESCGIESCFCDCGFGEYDPKSPDVVMNHYLQNKYVPDIAKAPGFKKWTGFKKGTHFNPDRKEDKAVLERISRTVVEEVTKPTAVKTEEKEAPVAEPVKLPIISPTIEETKDERSGST